MIAVPPLMEAVAKAKVEGGGDILARSFYLDLRVKKIVGSAMLSTGLSFDFRDDLLQTTFSVLAEYVAHDRVTDPDGIYSFIYASAFNSARSLRNQEFKNGAYPQGPATQDGDERGERDLIDEGASVDQGGVIDIRRARNKIASILKDRQRDPMQTHPLIANVAPAIRVAKPAAASKKTHATRQLSPEQQELVQIIASLGYKHEEFAADIGIGMSRLASYLYGRTMTVPNDIMTRARGLQKQAAPVVERWKKAYAKPMPEIIAGWEKALGLAPSAKGNDDILASILEVNPVTVYRWRKQDTTPQMHSIAKMDGRIREELERRKRHGTKRASE